MPLGTASRLRSPTACWSTDQPCRASPLSAPMLELNQHDIRFHPCSEHPADTFAATCPSSGSPPSACACFFAIPSPDRWLRIVALFVGFSGRQGAIRLGVRRLLMARGDSCGACEVGSLAGSEPDQGRARRNLADEVRLVVLDYTWHAGQRQEHGPELRPGRRRQTHRLPLGAPLRRTVRPVRCN